MKKLSKEEIKKFKSQRRNLWTEDEKNYLIELYTKENMSSSDIYKSKVFADRHPQPTSIKTQIYQLRLAGRI